MDGSLQRIECTARRHPRCAIALFAKLEQSAQDAGAHALQLDALYRRYFVKERLGEAPDLLDALYTGLQLAENLSLAPQAGHMLEAIGRIRYTQGVYRDAVKYWTRCIDLCKLTQDTRSLVEARIGLGQIYDAMGDSATAARVLQDAGTILKQLDDPYLNSKHAINLAVNQLNLAQLESAKALFEYARQEAERGAIAEYAAEVEWHLGCLALQENNLKLAENLTRSALDLALACGYQWLQGAALHTYAEILLRQNKTADALTVYQAALSHAQQVDSRAQQAQCSDALSRLYEKAGDSAQALYYARQYQALAQELSELSTSDKFRELREYDLSQKSPVEILLDLSSGSHLEEKEFSVALQLIADAALDILRIEGVCIWLTETDAAGDTGQLVCHTLKGPAGLHLSVGQRLDQNSMPCYLASLSRSRTPLVAHDVRLHPAAAELRQLFGDCPLRSLLEVPLRMHGKAIGVISFAQCEKQRNWSREDVLFGSHIGNLVQQMFGLQQSIQTQHQLELHVAHRTHELQEQTEKLEIAHRNIFLLSELGREITTKLDREDIMASLYRHVHILMPAEIFAIGLYRPERGQIEFPCNILNGQNLLPYSRDMEDRDLLSVWCIRHQKEIYINDIYAEYQNYIGIQGLNRLTADSSYPDLQQKIIPLSHIYVPLQVKNKTIGLIAVQSTKKNTFQRVHVDMLMTLAAYTAVAIDNADTYQQLSSAQQILMSKEKLAALGSLVAGVAHELNTPLGNCVLTASTLLEQTKGFMQQLESGNIKRSGLNQFTHAVAEANELLMRNLTNASELLSSFKQVSVDQASQQRRNFNLLQTSHEIVRTLQNRIQKNGHSLQLEIPPDIQMHSFPGPYGQVISNFINNSLLHAFAGRERGEMHLSAQTLADDQVQIVFSDNGQGISAEHLRRIFDPFFTTKLGHGGSGLGLSIVHNIVTDLLGGTIQVASTYGKGTQITLTLPMQST